MLRDAARGRQWADLTTFDVVHIDGSHPVFKIYRHKLQIFAKNWQVWVRKLADCHVQRRPVAMNTHTLATPVRPA